MALELINIFTRLAHQHKKSLLIFSTIGLINTGLYAGLFAFFLHLFPLHHFADTSAAFLLTTAFQFLANRKITFKVTHHNYLPQLLKYGILLLINYLVTLTIVQVTLWLSLSLSIAVVLTTGTTPLISYLLFKYWIFQNNSSLSTE